MEKKNKICVNLGLSIFELLLMYMTTGNIIYIFTQINEDFFEKFDLVIGILDILLSIYLLILNTKCIFNVNSKTSKSNIDKKNTLLVISNISSYIYFCGILYRMESYILYGIATIAIVLIVLNYNKIFGNKKIVIKDKNKVKNIKLITICIILITLFTEFWQFNNITKSLSSITEMENSQIVSTDENYNIKLLYQNHRNSVFFKFISSIAVISIMILSTITNKKNIKKITDIAEIVMCILCIMFLANNNVLYAYIQMGLIYLLYPIIININVKKNT